MLPTDSIHSNRMAWLIGAIALLGLFLLGLDQLVFLSYK
jgi:hypothetical protein